MIARLSIVVLLGASLCGAELRAGRAAVKITPPRGMPMSGYYHVRLNEGVHDDLYAKALALESEGARAVLVALDLIGAPRPIVEEARRLAAGSSGLKPEQIMISGTHTHTGPELGIRLRGVDEKTLAVAKQYAAELPRAIAESIRLAVADLQPARLWAGAGSEHGISFIRRYLMKDGSVGWNPGKRNPNILRPMGSVDPEVPVVFAENAQGKALAAYVNFANHLDTVGGMQFSADYPYTLAKVLGAAKGEDLLTIFTIGTAGNINHVNVNDAAPQKGHGEAARIGGILAAAVLKTWPRLEEVRPGPLRARSEIVRLPLSPYPKSDVEQAKQIVAAYGKPGASPFYDQVHAFKVIELEARDGKPLEAEVQVITLGEQVAWVGLPGEIFVELGKSIKLRSPYPRTIIAELANGAIGYVPDRKAYAEGAYEVISARMAPGGGEMLVESAVRMLLADYHPKPAAPRR
ncbi:MAG: neutral/alkaline non-lysosomal ceramidase N-terminal domain-containing protein [Acidobacteria bacterium]|nr:neutral/alkaline non-lysosomal ceramidase N-terminal domain-containing protein [Acidobacteriota bacterium]